ncbi:MAG: ABC transporter substrate-binding protein [Pirellulaceae bacterium]|nr:ABC transporter substrate-binding protein [Pirellulaceae bacterium]
MNPVLHLNNARFGQCRSVLLRGFLGLTIVALLVRPCAAQLLIDELAKRQRYDRITVRVEGKTETWDVEPLPYPERKLPANPKGYLDVRLLKDVEEIYEVRWKDIVKIDFFEDILLNEADVHVDAKEFDQAFDYFLFLHKKFPKMKRLDPALDRCLYLNAGDCFADGRDFEAMAILEELYARNSGFMLNGTSLSVLEVLDQTVGRILTGYLDQKNHAAARDLILRMRQSKYRLKTTAQASAHLDQLASVKRDEARALIDGNRLREADLAVRGMMRIYPLVKGGREIQAEIHRKYPLINVGVTQLLPVANQGAIDNWASRRTHVLMRRMIMEFEGLGLEKGLYRFSLGTFRESNDRRSLRMQIRPPAPGADREQKARIISGYDLATMLVQLGDPKHKDYVPQWAELFSYVEVEDVFDLRIHFRRPHVLPESLLQIYLNRDTTSKDPSHYDGPFKQGVIDKNDKNVVHYFSNPYNRDPPVLVGDGYTPPAEIVERRYENSEKLIGALRRREVDVVDHLLPSAAATLQGELGIEVVAYAQPTVHMLLPNYNKPFTSSELFRRALVFGIRREVILKELILRKNEVPGCAVLSGPFSRGTSDDDPLSYGYDQSLKPRRYSPWLAVTLMKLAERRLKEIAEQKSEKPPKLQTLILGHPADETARLACQAIKFQLDAIDFKTELKEFPPGQTRDPKGECDLVYARIAMWEPLVDAGRVLSRRGIAGIEDEHVNRGVRWLQDAKRWPEVTARSRELHRVCHDKVAVIPLWQTVDHFAYRSDVRLAASRPVTLYQGIQRWRLGTDVLPE